ncbi:MAG: CoA transferase [Proteobacteria bacterium]|nr:CoA transferase [Pseudomonadota bacterium]
MSVQTALPPGALAGVKVLDLSRVLAGPWAGQTLGDLGAEVVKVERPGTGDDTRAWGPPFVQDGQGRSTGESAYYMCANRNKRSVAIDFTQAEGQALVRGLAQHSDVLIENFKTGGLEAYGLDYASLSALNPRLVYCSVTGFGQTGPYAHRAGYDFLIQGMGGLMSVTGQPDGAPGGGPAKVGVALTDILTGLYASIAILAALQARERTGRGQHIDLALLDVQVACLANQGMNYLYGGQVPRRMGNAHPNTVPYQDFPTADGHMILAIGNDGQFARFCRAVGRPEWATDERFATNAARLAHREVLVPLLREVTVQRGTREWIALLEQHAVPCGPINTVADVFADEQVRARGMQLAMTHPQAGSVPLVASPMRLSDTPVQYRDGPPQLGQHTGEVLGERLGLSPEAIDELKRKGVLG